MLLWQNFGKPICETKMAGVNKIQKRHVKIICSGRLISLTQIPLHVYLTQIPLHKIRCFIWLTNFYGEISRSSHRRFSLRTPFLQNTSRRLLLRFYQKILTNLKNIRQKRFIYGEKKQNMKQRETNSNASYCN